MEQLLKRFAKQLNDLDEASIVNLRDKYLRIADNFEPTEEWQEAVLILSFIQAKMWQNQLFNYHWLKRTKLNGRVGVIDPIFNLGLNLKNAKPKKAAKTIAFSLNSEDNSEDKKDK